MPEAEHKPTIEVAYGTAERQTTVELEWRPGLTAREAVQRSGLLARFPEIDAGTLVLGIYGEQVGEGRILRAGDRVEICRPLRQDPRDMRRAALLEGGVIGQSRKSSG